MATIDQLDFVVVYYINDAKIIRIPCNFLLADSLRVVNHWLVNQEQNFYTHVAIEYQGETLIKVDLKDPQDIYNHFF